MHERNHLKYLANEAEVAYADLIKLNACIKIHLSDTGPERDIILAGVTLAPLWKKVLNMAKRGLYLAKVNKDTSQS